MPPSPDSQCLLVHSRFGSFPSGGGRLTVLAAKPGPAARGWGSAAFSLSTAFWFCWSQSRGRGRRVARSWGNSRKSCLNHTLAGTWFLAHGLKDADRLSFVRRQRSSASHTWEFARAVLAAVSRESCNLFVYPEGTQLCI